MTQPEKNLGLSLQLLASQRSFRFIDINIFY